MFFLVVSSYDNVLYGYQISRKYSVSEDVETELLPQKTHKITAEEGFEMKLIFLHKSHTACIRCLTSHDGLLISGSDDEAVKLYTLYKKREFSTLLEHQGSVGAAEILSKRAERAGNDSGKGWVLTSGGDGKIILWRTKDWRPILNFKGAKASSNNYCCLIAPHPSSRLALSLSPDCELKIWNLINGKCSYRKTVPNTRRKVPLLACAVPAGQRERPIGLKWSPSGSLYAILFPSHLAVYDPNDGELKVQIEEEFPLNSVEFISDELVVLSGESTSIVFYNLVSNSKVHEIKNAHKLRTKLDHQDANKNNRVKGVDLVPYSFLKDEKEEDIEDKLPFLASASSDGTVKVWDLNDLDNPNIKPLCVANTESRLTCITASGSFRADNDNNNNNNNDVDGENNSHKKRSRSPSPDKPRKK